MCSITQTIFFDLIPETTEQTFPESNEHLNSHLLHGTKHKGLICVIIQKRSSNLIIADKLKKVRYLVWFRFPYNIIFTYIRARNTSPL